MKAVISPSRLAGVIPAIASKSQAHRLLICASLSKGETLVHCATTSADIDATAACLRALGSDITRLDDAFFVRPASALQKQAAIDCGESGSTLRFLLPVLCALGVNTRIRMHGRLPERPLSPLWEELVVHGAVLDRPEPDCISVSGRIGGGTYTLASDVSSQFISGLLFALPLTGKPARIVLTGKTESADYIAMTLRALALFGISWKTEADGFSLPGGCRYLSPGEAEAEGDWSNAAFWICADRILGGTLSITGLRRDSPQGDRAVEAVSLRIAAGSAAVDCRNIPDLVPVLAVLASVSPGVTRFINAGRLRIKESDRLTTTASLIRDLGGEVEELSDGLVVTGKQALQGGAVTSGNDHRIAMSAAVAALACREPVILHGAQAVNKSYPDFWKDYARLGGLVTLEEEP